MDIKETLLLERARLDQTWSEVRDLFCRDFDRMMRLWALLAEPESLDQVRDLPEADLRVVTTLSILSLSELLQQAGVNLIKD